MLRSCRMPQFLAALARVQREHPGVEVVALAPRQYHDELRAAGVAQVVEQHSARLTVARLGLRAIGRLRALSPDAVVIPTMDVALRSSANLLWLAACIAAPTTVVCRDGTGWLVSGREIGRVALTTMFGWPAVPVMLAQMARAAVWPGPRRSPPPRRGQRILHIINHLGLGGAQTQCVALVNRMPAHVDVDVLLLSGDGASDLHEFTRPGVRVFVLQTHTRLGTTIDAIAEVCALGRYDIVHTWLSESNMLGSAAARLAGVPRIITSVRSLNPGWFPQWCQWWYRPADVLAARIADVVTVNARPLALDHARWAMMRATRVAVVRNGFDTSPGPASFATDVPLRQQLSCPQDVPIVGYVGRLSIEKDVATFLSAVALVLERGQPLHAVLIGDGPCAADLQGLAESLGISSHVTFLGTVPAAERLIGALDLLALTSRVEGFPNVLLEAMSHGVPVVSSDVGGVRDVVDEPDALFPAGDADAAAAAMQRVLSDPIAARARAARLRQRSRDEFSVERMVQRWLSLYRADTV